MTGTNSDPILIQDLRHIMRMHAFERKRRNPTLVLGIGTKHLHARDFFQSLEGIFRYFMFVRGNIVHTER